MDGTLRSLAEMVGVRSLNGAWWLYVGVLLSVVAILAGVLVWFFVLPPRTRFNEVQFRVDA